MSFLIYFFQFLSLNPNDKCLLFTKKNKLYSSFYLLFLTVESEFKSMLTTPKHLSVLRMPGNSFQYNLIHYLLRCWDEVDKSEID